MSEGSAGSPDNAASDTARVRLVLIRELETINTYEEMAQAAQSPQVRNFFLHLASEEKEHVAEATELLRALDSDLEAHFQKERSPGHFDQRAHAPAGAPASDSASAPREASVNLNHGHFPVDPKHIIRAVPAPPSTHTFTVGSLKRAR